MNGEELVFRAGAKGIEKILDVTVRRRFDRFIDEETDGIFRTVFVLQNEEFRSEGANLLDGPVITRNNPIGFVQRKFREFSPKPNLTKSCAFAGPETSGIAGPLTVVPRIFRNSETRKWRSEEGVKPLSRYPIPTIPT